MPDLPLWRVQVLQSCDHRWHSRTEEFGHISNAKYYSFSTMPLCCGKGLQGLGLSIPCALKDDVRAGVALYVVNRLHMLGAQGNSRRASGTTPQCRSLLSSQNRDTTVCMVEAWQQMITAAMTQ